MGRGQQDTNGVGLQLFAVLDIVILALMHFYTLFIIGNIITLVIVFISLLSAIVGLIGTRRKNCKAISVYSLFLLVDVLVGFTLSIILLISGHLLWGLLPGAFAVFSLVGVYYSISFMKLHCVVSKTGEINPRDNASYIPLQQIEVDGQQTFSYPPNMVFYTYGQQPEVPQPVMFAYPYMPSQEEENQ